MRVLNVGSNSTRVLGSVNLDVELFSDVDVVGDGQALPFRSNAFDVVVLSHVLEHVEHPLQMLREACRVARKLIIVKVPNAAFYHYNDSEDHIYTWNAASLKHLLSKACRDVRVYPTYRYLTLKDKLRVIIKSLLTAPNELTGVCRK